MKTTFLKLVLTLSLLSTYGAFASEGFDDLVRLLRAQDDATISYVRNSRLRYEFTVEEIQYLYDEMGVSPKIIEEALNAGKRQRAYEEGPREIRVIVAPPPDQTNMSLFFDALEPYGQWIEVDSTWVWRPQVASYNPNWRPYFDGGRWVYTDAGWAWSSDYSWGWAPFHYGRWNSHPIFGWIWTPDSVWGPAWVSWRSGETHYGWAPLPSSARFDRDTGFRRENVGVDFGLTDRDYRFVPVEKIFESGLTTQAVPQTTVINVYNNTTVVQNNIVYNDNRVYTRGPSIERARRASGREIREVHITDAQARTGEAIPRNRLGQDNFEVYRPEMKNTAPVTREVVEARQRAIEQKREQFRAQKVEKVDNEAARAAEKRQADFDAKQKMLDALADSRKLKKEESAEVTAARIKAREQEALQKQQELKHDIEARQQEDAKKQAVLAAEKQARLAAQEKADAAQKEALAAKQAENAAERARALQQEEARKQAAAAEDQARIAAREKEAAARKEALAAKQAETVAERQAKAAALQQEEAKKQAALAAEQQARIAAQDKAEAARKEALETKKTETAADKARALQQEEARKQALVAEQQARIAAQDKAEAARKEALEAKKAETAADKTRALQQEEARKQALAAEQQAKAAAQEKEAAARKEALEAKRAETAAELQAKAKARQDEEAKAKADAAAEAQARIAAREKAKEATETKRDERREAIAERFLEVGALAPKPAGAKLEVVAVINVKQGRADKAYNLIATGANATEIDALLKKGAKVRVKGKLAEDTVTVESVDEIGGKK